MVRFPEGGWSSSKQNNKRLARSSRHPTDHIARATEQQSKRTRTRTTNSSWAVIIARLYKRARGWGSGDTSLSSPVLTFDPSQPSSLSLHLHLFLHLPLPPSPLSSGAVLLPPSPPPPAHSLADPTVDQTRSGKTSVFRGPPCREPSALWLSSSWLAQPGKRTQQYILQTAKYTGGRRATTRQRARAKRVRGGRCGHSFGDDSLEQVITRRINFCSPVFS